MAKEWLGGDQQENLAIWKQASALYNTDANTVPFLFINSAIPRFHAGQDDMCSRLDQQQIYYEVHQFPDSPHTFWFFEPWYRPMIAQIDRFLSRIFVQATP